MPRVDVYVDPSCPWAWNTSRWLLEVAPHRGLRLSWRSYCLEIRDDCELPGGVPQQMREAIKDGRRLAHKLLRIFEAARASGADDQLIGRLYTEWGRRFMSGYRSPDAKWITEALQAAGAGGDLAAAADDEAWDEAIRTSMATAYTFGGEKTQTPVIVLAGDPPRGLKGPVISMAPTGEAAVRLWDAIEVLLAEPGFFELARPRTSPPTPAPLD